MSTLKEERQQLADLMKELLPGAVVHTYVPEQLNGPAVLCVPGSPYVEDGNRFGEHVANFEAWLISGIGTNAVITDWLDNAIQSSIRKLIDAGWTVTGVDEPFIYGQDSTKYLAVIVRLQTSIKL